MDACMYGVCTWRSYCSVEGKEQEPKWSFFIRLFHSQNVHHVSLYKTDSWSSYLIITSELFRRLSFFVKLRFHYFSLSHSLLSTRIWLGEWVFVKGRIDEKWREECEINASRLHGHRKRAHNSWCLFSPLVPTSIFSTLEELLGREKVKCRMSLGFYTLSPL